MKKTVLIEPYRKNLYLASKARENHGAVRGIHTLTLRALLQEESDEEVALLLSIYHLFQNEKQNYPVYGNMFAYPSFFKEVLTFTRNCIRYDIPASSLPERDNRERELKKIVEVLMSCPLREKQNRAKRDLCIMQAKDREDITVIPSFVDDPCYDAILKELSFETVYYDTHPAKHLYHADNPAMEIEAIAQDIVTKGKPCNVILMSSASLPFLKETFARYNIPYSLINDHREPLLFTRFMSLVNAAMHRDGSSLSTAIESDAFPIPFPSELLSFLKETLADKEMDGTLADSLVNNPAFADQERDIRQKENGMSFWFEKESEDLALLYSSTNPQTIIRNAYTIITHHPSLAIKECMEDGMALRNILNTCISDIQNEDDLQFLLASLSSYSPSSLSLSSSFCTVTDVRHPVDPKEVTYVIGCTASDYPGFKALSGIFDEQYVKEIPGYPSMQERYNLYMDNFAWIHTSATREVHYSYGENDLQGREVQIAYDLESMFKGEKAKLLRPVVLSPAKSRNHHLSKDTARALYVENDTITGSISTIERWFNCPYSWFVQSGLKVRKSSIPDADAAGIGTIQHAVMEQAVKKYGKDYTKISEEEIRDIIHACFMVLKKLHPYKETMLALSEERMLQSLLKAMAFLDQYEKHTSFVPTYAEKKFVLPITEHIILRGTIDRMDVFNQAFRIIDYKSSPHALSPSAIASGTQLQLLSYLITAAEDSSLTPYGAHYFSLKEPDLSLPAATLAGRGKNREVVHHYFTEEELEEALIKERQLKGSWYDDNPVTLDDSGNFIAGLKTAHSYPLAKEVMHTLYEHFYDAVSNGDISLAPLENACAFCDYRTVCRFHGNYRKRPEIVEAKGV